MCFLLAVAEPGVYIGGNNASLFQKLAKAPPEQPCICCGAGVAVGLAGLVGMVGTPPGAYMRGPGGKHLW